MTEKSPCRIALRNRQEYRPLQLKKYLRKLAEGRLAMHDVLVARDGKLCYEAYWKPFDPEFRHRLYSCSKSFVSVAIGMLIERGQLSLEDKCVDFFFRQSAQGHESLPARNDYTRFAYDGDLLSVWRVV